MKFLLSGLLLWCVCSLCGAESGVVHYEDFGARGDGVTDDQPAIARAHAYANKHNLPVKAAPDAKYYIGGVVETGEIWPIPGERTVWFRKQSLAIGHQAVDMLQNLQNSSQIKLLPLIKGE